jgi:hypothetical protein
MSREKHLKDQGWQEPLDSSPIDTPEGWDGGPVVNTGGGIYCRIWEHEGKQLQVIYNLTQDSTVAVNRLRHDDKVGGLIHDEVIDTEQADEQTDQAQWQVAKTLIEKYD